jgi:cystine transport system ATP-binding protein
VEIGSAEQVFRNPVQERTRRFVSSINAAQTFSE